MTPRWPQIAIGPTIAVVVFVLALIFRPLGPPEAADLAQDLRIGVLKFGTVNWQLETLTHHGLDQAQGLKVTLLPLASKNATAVALQAGEVDMIVSDWIWVLRQRAAGADFLFYPYSTALGALLVGKDSDIANIDQLAGKRLGIAGGPVDKSWLILQSWAGDRRDLDFEGAVERVFAAPPLLNEHLRSGSLDALLTFWPYAARLEAAGFTRLLSVSDILAESGIAGSPSLVGYVFGAQLAEERPAAVEGFFKAVAEANALLGRSDEEWARLRPIMKVGSDQEFQALKAGYRSGIPSDPGEESLEDAKRLFEILAEAGGERLLGPSTVFDPAAFWSAAER